MLKHIEATTENAVAVQRVLYWHLLQHGVPEDDALKVADYLNDKLVQIQLDKLKSPEFLDGKQGGLPPAYYGEFNELGVLLALARVSIGVPRASVLDRLRKLNPSLRDDNSMHLQIHSLAVTDVQMLGGFLDELLELAKSMGVRAGDNEDSRVGEVRASILQNPELFGVLHGRGFELKSARARKIRVGKTVLYFADFVRKKT